MKEPTGEALYMWEQWVATRPPAIQALAARFLPWKSYMMSPPGQAVRVVSYSEDGTLTVLVRQEDNPHSILLFEREVFGVDPGTLTELPDSACPPAPG